MSTVEPMHKMPRIQIWPIVVVAVLVALWLGVSGLLLASRGNPEKLLQESFRGVSRPDAFEFLNGAIVWFWVIHSILLLSSACAVWCRRHDVLVALLIGPALSLGLGVVIQDWSDPNWVIFMGVCVMGWIASVSVGLLYWVVRRVPSDAALKVP